MQTDWNDLENEGRRSTCHTLQVLVLFLLYHYMAWCCKSVGVMGQGVFIVWTRFTSLNLQTPPELVCGPASPKKTERNNDGFMALQDASLMCPRLHARTHARTPTHTYTHKHLISLVLFIDIKVTSSAAPVWRQLLKIWRLSLELFSPTASKTHFR